MNKLHCLFIVVWATLAILLGVLIYREGRERISPIYPPSVQRWNTLIIEAAHEFDLPPNMIAAVMTVESCGDATASNYRDGQGLMQVTTWWFNSSKLSHIADDPFDTRDNVRMGAAIMRYNLDVLKGNERLALAAYTDNTGVNVHEMSVGAARHYNYTWRMYFENSQDVVDEWRAKLGQYCV